MGASSASDPRWHKTSHPDEAQMHCLSQELAAPGVPRPLDHISVVPPAVQGGVSLSVPRGRSRDLHDVRVCLSHLHIHPVLKVFNPYLSLLK